MARPVNGILAVAEFINSGVGEYQFENALYSSQTDETGSGAYSITIGHLVYVQATDLNTATPITGVYHRYRLTSLEVIDVSLISGTITWDEPGDEVDAPTNGSICLVAEPTTNQKIGLPPIDDLYPEVPFGASLAALLLDVRFIIDKLSSGSSNDKERIDNLETDVKTVQDTVVELQAASNQNSVDLESLKTSQLSFYSHIQTEAASYWLVNHNQNSTNFTHTLLDETGHMILPNELYAIDENNLAVEFLVESSGKLSLIFQP